MSKYRVKDTDIKHDGKLYKAGELIDLTADQASRLSVETEKAYNARKTLEEESDKNEDKDSGGGNPALLVILDNNISALVKAIVGLPIEDLQTLRAAEENGNTRSGAIDAIDKEIGERKEEEHIGFLDKDEKEIFSLLSDTSDEDLLCLRSIEEEGSNRENIIEAIDEEIKSR